MLWSFFICGIFEKIGFENFQPPFGVGSTYVVVAVSQTAPWVESVAFRPSFNLRLFNPSTLTLL
jgi:hypothetical protein